MILQFICMSISSYFLLSHLFSFATFKCKIVRFSLSNYSQSMFHQDYCNQYVFCFLYAHTSCFIAHHEKEEEEGIISASQNWWRNLHRDYEVKNSIKITLRWRFFLINFNCHPLKACIFVKFNNHKKTTASIIYLFLNWIICTLKEKRASERQWTAFFFRGGGFRFFINVPFMWKKEPAQELPTFFFRSFFLSSRLVICQIFKYILKDFLFCVCSRVYSYKFF